MEYLVSFNYSKTHGIRSISKTSNWWKTLAAGKKQQHFAFVQVFQAIREDEGWTETCVRRRNLQTFPSSTFHWEMKHQPLLIGKWCRWKVLEKSSTWSLIALIQPTGLCMSNNGITGWSKCRRVTSAGFWNMGVGGLSLKVWEATVFNCIF